MEEEVKELEDRSQYMQKPLLHNVSSERNSKKYKILHIMSGKERGGIRNVVSYLSEGLQKSSWEIILLLMGKGEMAMPEGLKAICFPRRRRIDFDQFRKVLKFSREEKVDIVHTHSVIGNLYGWLMKYFLKKAHHIIHVHANLSQELLSSQQSFFKRKFLFWGNKIALKRCHKVIANSVHTKQYLEQCGISDHKITVIYNGIDPEDVRSKAMSKKNGGQSFQIGDEVPGRQEIASIGKSRIVGTVGRFMPIKNYSLLLRAACEVLKKENNVQFLLIGDGQERKSLEALASDLGISDKVAFPGWVKNPFPLIATMDLFVLTSRWEGFGIVLLEAMALEKPIVATKVGGVPEIVQDDRNGILIPSENTESLTKAILHLLNNSSLREEMGKRGKEIVEGKFTVKKMIGDIEKLYASEMKNKSGSLSLA